MSDLSLFYGPNAGYVLDLYERYSRDPASLDPLTRSTFDGWSREGRDPLSNGRETVSTGAVGLHKIAGAVRLATMIRSQGHRAASVNPLAPPAADSLELSNPGLEARLGARLDARDMAALPSHLIGGPLAGESLNALEAVTRLRRAYSGSSGYEFDHVQDEGERDWLFNAVESGRFQDDPDGREKQQLLVRLTEVETFERFLHTTFVGQKRFSLEGTDMIVPMLDRILRRAGSAGMREVVIGMAHRGRLNVLAHLLGKPYAAILAEFHAAHASDEEPSVSGSGTYGWTGDVKYHQGGRLPYSEEGAREMPVTLAPNPSHLEVVNPVILGRARAAQEKRDAPGAPTRDPKASGAILIHGDAAFPGQGIVAETLNLSQIAGYGVGGAMHIILNNQIGFTTSPQDSRSTLYSSDLAKGFEIPIVHVNADDPLACIAAAEMAYEYCARFHKDFLIDLVGYRRWGHNEADEPAYTHPLMYGVIAGHPTVREKWAGELEQDQVLGEGEAEGMVRAVQERLQSAQAESQALPPPKEHPTGYGAVKRRASTTRVSELAARADTAVPADRLRALNEELLRKPDGFTVNPKLERMLQRRRDALEGEGEIDWAHAETLAFASLLSEGTPIRFTGQDVERGTFSHRHLVLHDPAIGARHVPLQALASARASFAVHNSPLSENAVLGYEYGYSIHARGTLALWEAQFGDFANSAQVILDQFLVSGQAKWRQAPSLVLLLPHGHEGQGPEHTSARPERFLQLCANENLSVVNCTTAAQYFHALRRQAALLDTAPRPLVVLSPKSLLRHPLVASPLAGFTKGKFQPVLDDPAARRRADRITRVILCSGKVYVDLVSHKGFAETERVAVIRLEELYPFPAKQLRAVLSQYPGVRQIDWLQEEPSNMGAWSFVGPEIRNLVGERMELSYLGRPESASPAEGSYRQHTSEQARILAAGLMAAPD